MPVNGNHGREKIQNCILKLASQISNEDFIYMDMTYRGLSKAELLDVIVCFLLWLIQNLSSVWILALTVAPLQSEKYLHLQSPNNSHDGDQHLFFHELSYFTTVTAIISFQQCISLASFACHQIGAICLTQSACQEGNLQYSRWETVLHESKRVKLATRRETRRVNTR